MKKIVLSTLGLFILVFFVIQTPVFTNSTQAPAARTGAPFDGSCSSVGCHNGPPSSEMPGEILITMNGSTLDTGFSYMPGQTYTVNFSSNLASMLRFGFQLVAVDSADANAGSLAVTNSTNTVTSSSQGRTYIGHKDANTNDTWSFSWTAPSNNIGPVTFYYVLNDANNSGTAMGDNIIEGSRTFNGSTSTGIFSPESNLVLEVFPNPVTAGSFQLRGDESLNGHAFLFDLNGSMVQSWNLSGSTPKLNLQSAVSDGIYLLNVVSDGKSATRQLIIQ